MKIFQMIILFETIKFHHMGPLEAGGPGQLPPLPPLNPALSWTRRAGLHNSESSKGQIDQHKLAAGRKIYFVVVWKKFWKDK